MLQHHARTYVNDYTYLANFINIKAQVLNFPICRYNIMMNNNQHIKVIQQAKQ